MTNGSGVKIMFRYGLVLVLCATFLPTASAGGDKKKKKLPKTAEGWVELMEKSKKPKSRAIIALILAQKYGAEEACVFPALRTRLQKDKDEEVRNVAALALADIGPQANKADGKAVSLVLAKAMLEDKSNKVRQTAAESLGGKMLKYGEFVVRPLAEALKSDHPGTRASAAKVLKDLGPTARLVRDNIIEVAKNEKLDRFTRIYVFQTLTKFHETEDDKKLVLPILRSVLTEANPPEGVRQVVIDGIVKFGEKANVAAKDVLAIFQTPANPRLLRRSAAIALGKMSPPEEDTWKAVQAVLAEDSGDLHAEAIRLGGQHCKDQKGFVKAMMKMCSRGNQEAKLAAIHELGELGAKGAPAIDTLKDIASNAVREIVREQASKALENIQKAIAKESNGKEEKKKSKEKSKT